jgi:hypothetical protein
VPALPPKPNDIARRATATSPHRSTAASPHRSTAASPRRAATASARRAIRKRAPPKRPHPR